MGGKVVTSTMCDEYGNKKRQWTMYSGITSFGYEVKKYPSEFRELIRRYFYQRKRLSRLGTNPDKYWERKRLEKLHNKLKTKCLLLGIQLPREEITKSVIRAMR